MTDPPTEHKEHDVARLGAIADDLTGATDQAIALTTAGYRTAVVVGAEEVPAITDVDAVVLALKSRSAPVNQAVTDSLRALELLRNLDCDRFYFKYCSTFDSTPQGNIGPVAEALLDEIGGPGTIYCPAFPANGRTVYRGHLFVGNDRLDESPMRHHPLNPMTDSSIVRWLDAQTAAPVDLVPLEVVRQGPAAVREAMDSRMTQGSRHIVMDAVMDDDIATVAEATTHLPLVTGGSALGFALDGPMTSAVTTISAPGPYGLVLSGSAAQATQEQVRHGLETGTGLRLDPTRLRADLDTAVTDTVEQMLSAHSAPFVVYATKDPSDVHDTAHSAVLEEALAAIASRLVDGAGVRALLVAGGETSGAVVSTLGVSHVLMGPAVDPGVAWGRAVRFDGEDVMLLLKSGNFGGPDLFSRAWETFR